MSNSTRGIRFFFFYLFQGFRLTTRSPYSTGACGKYRLPSPMTLLVAQAQQEAHLPLIMELALLYRPWLNIIYGL